LEHVWNLFVTIPYCILLSEREKNKEKKEVMKMTINKINSNINQVNGKFNFRGNNEPIDKVVLGGNSTDNTMILSEQLKKMKSMAAPKVSPAYAYSYRASIRGGFIGVGGIAALSYLAGFRGFGFLGLALFGGVAGVAIGGKVGWDLATSGGIR
jgi:hypothetical protein